ncbi:VOC family protein [Sphingobacterium bambusae]|uniref:VOC family protein n=1 Tax=Sphingobacterium bambusae TaxID=662858 RepID=A0ABW6BCU5_9SPHI|nr:VOC family protein [Sphingobacterium bambusae]WPL49506.1 VOC family protein [Sphingobacterium bambusae]
MNNTLQLSHVLYRVQDLHQSVKSLQDAGFIVEYGTDPRKAYNALIWFEKGVFIEIYQNSGLPAPVKWFMKTFGYAPILDRMNKWEQVENGWCEWSLESTVDNLAAEKIFLKESGVGFKFHRAKRKDTKGQTLRWDLLIPNDIVFPFLMSAYVPNPRPQHIRHPNGVSAVSALHIGSDGLDMKLLELLLGDMVGLRFVAGKGLQHVELEGGMLDLREILK